MTIQKHKNKKKGHGESRFIVQENLDKIGEVAIYYGFTPMKSPVISKSDINLAKEVLDDDYVDEESEKHGKLPLHVEEKIALIRLYHEQNMQSQSQPVMMYFKDVCKHSSPKNNYERYADLEILGSSGSINEAILIQTARAMIKEEGYDDTAVEINSIGDRESINRFTRELTAYYRKKINEMSPECRQILKEDPFELLSSHEPSAKELNENAPRSIDFLSESCRRHLEEVLEYIEALNIPYSINNKLIGNKKYCNEIIFTIVNANNSADKKPKHKRILAIGIRYNGLAKRLGLKKDVHGVGVSLLIENNKNNLRKAVKKTLRPIASFIQLGIESKLIALDIVEKLRQVKIPLHLSLAKDRLGAQVSSIEKYHTPYVIVMGKKEAMDHTVIVRKNDTHSQETISLEELPKYMKKIESRLK